MTELNDNQRAYLLEVLRLNPVYQSDEILVARSSMLDCESYDARSKRQLASREYADRKAAARKQIADIRDAIWTTPLDEIEAMLTDFDVSEFPEYQKDAETFRIILDTREKLPEVSNNKNFSNDFFECVKQSLISGPSERAEIEERVRASFSNRTLKKNAKKTVEIIQGSLPDLYQIRRTWFDNMFSKQGLYPLS